MSLGTRYTNIPVTIAAGQSISDAVKTGFRSVPVGVIFPGSMTGTGIKFEMTHDGTTFSAVFDEDGNEVSVTKVVGYRALKRHPFEAINELKIKSSTNEVSTVTFILVCKKLN